MAKKLQHNEPYASQPDRVRRLLSQYVNYPAFTYGGRDYKGQYADAVKQFLLNNPEGGDFSVWLQQNWKQIN